MVIYSVLSQSEIIDEKLIKSKIWNRDKTKYMLFKETNPKTQLGSIHSNNVKNIRGKFKVLEDANINDTVTYGEEEVFL